MSTEGRLPGARRAPGDPMGELLREGESSAFEGSTPPVGSRLRWVLVAIGACLTYGLGFSVFLGIDVALGWFESTLEGMIRNHPAFGALWLLAEPAFVAYYTIGPWVGILFGVPAGRVAVGIIVASFAFPMAVFQATVVVTLLGIGRFIVVSIRQQSLSRRPPATRSR